MAAPSLDAIKRRCEDAWVLWEQGRQEGALLVALVAVAAASRRRYPKPVRDRDAFERYLREMNPWKNISLEYKGQLCSVEFLFYEALRCNLVHEGGLPFDVQFLPDDDRLAFEAGGAPDFVLKLSPGWMFMLLAVASAELPYSSDEIFSGRMWKPDQR